MNNKCTVMSKTKIACPSKVELSMLSRCYHTPSATVPIRFVLRCLSIVASRYLLYVRISLLEAARVVVSFPVGTTIGCRQGERHVLPKEFFFLLWPR